MRKFSPLFRLWHWSMAAAIGALLLTVLLRESFFDKHAVAQTLIETLAASGIVVPDEAAIKTAKAIRASMWSWHYFFGFVLAATVGLRIYLTVRKEAQLPILKLRDADSKEERIKAAVHLVICLCVALITISGVFYYFYETFGFEKSAVHWVKTLHAGLLWPLVAAVALHVGGVIRHELRHREPIVSRMIHGEA